MVNNAMQTWAIPGETKGGEKEQQEEDLSWPFSVLLPEARKNGLALRLIAIDYDSAQYRGMTSVHGGHLNVAEVARLAVQHLVGLRIGVDAPVIFVTHSTGTLVARRFVFLLILLLFFFYFMLLSSSSSSSPSLYSSSSFFFSLLLLPFMFLSTLFLLLLLLPLLPPLPLPLFVFPIASFWLSTAFEGLTILLKRE